MSKPTAAEVQQALTENMSALLMVPADQIDPSASFLEQGADSIVLVDAVRRIENAYGVSITMQQFFEELPSIEKLSNYIAEHALDSSEIAAKEATANSDAAQQVPESAVSTPAARSVGSSTSSGAKLMQAQLELVKHTIQQQNRLIAEKRGKKNP